MIFNAIVIPFMIIFDSPFLFVFAIGTRTSATSTAAARDARRIPKSWPSGRYCEAEGAVNNMDDMG